MEPLNVPWQPQNKTSSYKPKTLQEQSLATCKQNKAISLEIAFRSKNIENKHRF